MNTPTTDFADCVRAAIDDQLPEVEADPPNEALRALMRDRGVTVAELMLRNSSAQRATLDTVAALLDVLARTGGYMPHDDQATLRAAEALLVEHGYVDDGQRTRRNSSPGRSAP